MVGTDFIKRFKAHENEHRLTAIRVKRNVASPISGGKVAQSLLQLLCTSVKNNRLCEKKIICSRNKCHCHKYYSL